MALPRSVLVCEFITGGGLAGSPLPAALAHEGGLMAAALVRGLAALEGVEVTVARDPRLPPLLAARNVRIAGDPWPQWARLMSAAERVLAVAPEGDGLLARVLALAGGRAVGATPRAVRIASSKYLTARCLAAAGVPVVTTLRGDAVARRLPAGGQWVVKPDDGAGCEDTHRVRGGRGLARALGADPGRYVVQPWVAGQALSATVVVHDGTPSLLAASVQHVSCDGGTLRLAALTVNGAAAHAAPLRRLATAVVAALPGLAGPLGIDCVVDGGRLRVLEVNARLTTSWAGLAESLGLNPVPALLSPAAARAAGEALAAARPVRIDLDPAAAA